ncbi:hypothetical protein L596_011348 [Steinernema carpocapsae]|uniref:Uncharacterized protein n=2 Tax=Steinernema carpocapsae TaxID=34508 RepID=A0A4U5NU19_STECR|nr:hypothetical protein L596_011348 [Steinernema carpocapsae]
MNVDAGSDSRTSSSSSNSFSRKTWTMDTAKIYALLKFFNAMGKTVSLVPVKTLEQFQQSEHFSVMLQFLRTGMYQKKTSTGNVKALLLDHLQETFGEEYVSLCSLQKLNKGNLWEISKLMALCVHAIYQRQELADKVNDMVLKQLKDDQLKHVRQIVTGMRKSDSKHWTQILKEGGHCRPPSLTQQGAEQKDSKLGKTIQSLSFSGKSDFKKSSVMSKLLKDRVNQEGENTFKPMVKLKEACLSASQPRTQGKLEVKERKTGRKRTQSESKQRTPKKERLNLNEANSKTIKEIEDSTVKRSNKVVAATKEKSPKNIKLAKETGTSGSNNDKGGGGRSILEYVKA